MTFTSILYNDTAQENLRQRPCEPDFFNDLNLDQIVEAVTAEKREYDLTPFFYTSLQDVSSIAFRHEILHDLEHTNLLKHVEEFAEGMRSMREDLAQAEKFYYRRQKERWLLDAAASYCRAVKKLLHDLSVTEITSRGFLAFREYLSGYTASDHFKSLDRVTLQLLTDLSSIKYCLHINGLEVQVRRYEGEPDYNVEIETTFERFKQGAVKEFPFKFTDRLEMNHVEASVLDLVAQAYPEIFAGLEDFFTTRKNFFDQTLTIFDREIQFYIGYLRYISRFKKTGLNFCYPEITQTRDEVYAYQGFDLALAGKLFPQEATPVCNDFHLKGQERIIVVTGPNQGGKTTFSRSFGQLHYLASLGLPVPGSSAKLFLFDQIFTHFEKEESLVNLSGKLQDDLVRMHAILEKSSPKSIVIVNEIFASTTFRDATALSKKIADRLIELDLFCVWVTFIDELASLSGKTVSMAANVVPDNPALRTYKLVRRPADGLAYALAIAEKYRLTYDMIKERIRK
jgi:DNA mismatch repair ATPase MutS